MFEKAQQFMLNELDPKQEPRGRISRLACRIPLYATLKGDGKLQSVAQAKPKDSTAEWHTFFTDQIVYGAPLACRACALYCTACVLLTLCLGAETGCHAFDVYERQCFIKN